MIHFNHPSQQAWEVGYWLTPCTDMDAERLVDAYLKRQCGHTCRWYVTLPDLLPCGSFLQTLPHSSKHFLQTLLSPNTPIPWPGRVLEPQLEEICLETKEGLQGGRPQVERRIVRSSNRCFFLLTLGSHSLSIVLGAVLYSMRPIVAIIWIL